MTRPESNARRTRFSPRSARAGGTASVGFWLVCLGTLAAPTGAQQLPIFEEEDEGEPRSFSIYATEGAMSLADSVLRHLAAGRDLDALVELQRLLEEHAAEVLNAERPRINGRRSEGDVHYGAANWARKQLFGFLPEMRERYRERYAQRAGEALASALESGDRRALTRLAQRWPITLEAERAWLALGDLELELGNAADARAAWERALGVALNDPDFTLNEPLAALEKRLAAAGLDEERVEAHLARQRLAALLSSQSTPLESQSPWATTLTGSDAAVFPPHSDADSWSPFELDLDHPFDRPRSRNPVLYPVRWQDLLLFTTSFELVAVGAYTGELAWKSGRDDRWDRLTKGQRETFEEAIERDDTLISPAVGQDVAVAALQIPVNFERNLDYGEMKIIVKIPNRRLFAFDANTGEPLWDTAPPSDWDGESGGFVERMRVVGPPIISGSRVLAPCARLQGRIEYHVGCFDLFSGDLLWSTPIITGQRERNMFGRSVTEYVAPPLVVSGDKVVVQTQLGTLATLDLFTGDMLWEVLYEKIAMQATHSFSAPRRRQYWNSAPPAVAGGTILATPDDSEFLIGVDLETGTLLWSQRIGELQRLFGLRTDLEYLLGADEYSIYLGGSHMVALEFPLGVHDFGSTTLERPQVQWKWPTGSGESIPSRSPRPVLTQNHVYVPRSLNVAVLGRSTGALEETLTSLSGNLLVADGELFALRGNNVSGRFDWDRLVDRAREEWQTNPSEPVALNLVELLEKRGRSSAQKARLQDSARQLEEARSVLEGLSGGEDSEAHPRVQERLHSVLRAEAATQRYLGRGQAAKRSLLRARALAPSREALRDNLLEELDLVSLDDIEGWVELTELLARDCGELDVDVFAFDRSERTGLTVLTPVLTYDGEPQDQSYPVPVGLWVLLARFERDLDDAREFEDLHQLLDAYADLRLNGEALGNWASDRIARKLAAGERGGYERFEEEAAEMLRRARENGDAPGLARVSERYPHSSAAASASGVLLDLALETSDTATVAEIVLGDLPGDWSWRYGTEEDFERLAQLAYVIGRAEDPRRRNPELRAALAERLARFAPDLQPELPAAEPRSMLAWSERWVRGEALAPAATRSSFSPDIHKGRGDTLRGRYRPLGELPATDASSRERTGDVYLFARDGQVQAIGTHPTLEPTWSYSIDERDMPHSWSRGFSTSAGRVHLATQREVICLGREEGELRWTWDRRGLSPLAVRSGDGVVVVQAESEDSEDTLVVVALDAAQGVELWRLRIDVGSFDDEWLVRDGYVVLLPEYDGEGVVVDLFTGSRVSSFQPSLPGHSSPKSWVQDGQLIMPRFMQRDPENNYLTAFDLETGRESWRLSFENIHGGSQLVRVLSYGDEVFLVVQAKGRKDGRPGGIYGLNVHNGLVDATPLAEFTSSDRWIGASQSVHTRLDAPYVFLLTDRVGDGSQSLRAIHLPYGRRWDTSLRLTEEDLYLPGVLQPPALSHSTVVVAWRELRQSPDRRTETIVALFDRASGELIETRNLPKAMKDAPLKLQSLGEGLVLCGADQMEIWK